MKIPAIIVAACFLFQIHKAQTTLTLQCSQDAAIGFHDGANTSGNNYGTAIQNAAYMVPAVADPNGYNGNRALVDFNLTSIPAGATLISASLNLYALGPFGSYPGHFGTNTSYLQRITQGWGEFTATWNNQPSSSAQNQVSLNQSATATQDYLNINVTALVQDMLSNPSASHGFLLKLVNEVSTNGLVFASRDHSNTSLHPTLIITYKVCSPNIALTIGTAPSTLICAGASVNLTAGGAATYTWTANQQTLWQGASLVVSPAVTTVYNVNALTEDNCPASTQVTIQVKECTGLAVLSSYEAAIFVYPSPNAGNFTVAAGELYFDRIEITDMQGRIVKEYAAGPGVNSLSINGIEGCQGIYFCHVISGTKTLAVKKIVITQ